MLSDFECCTKVDMAQHKLWCPLCDAAQGLFEGLGIQARNNYCLLPVAGGYHTLTNVGHCGLGALELGDCDGSCTRVLHLRGCNVRCWVWGKNVEIHMTAARWQVVVNLSGPEVVAV